MRKLLLFCYPLFLLLNGGTAFSQEFGGNPPSLKWRQINTDTARVIFPAGLDSQANRVASIVHYLAGRKPFSLGDRLRKINIVLQNQTTIPNAYVQLGPFRSEFYLTPAFNSFDQGSLPWDDQLAVHEYKHVQQFNNFDHGISHLMRVLFGQDGYTLAINAAIPDWFYEGDAVFNETAVTAQGRGRLPLFVNSFPALWQAGKNYSWMKLRNGSYKDYVPNHYYLGYLLVNYGREKYGIDFWKKVSTDASAYKGLFYPFQQAVKKYAGVEFPTFVREAFDYYRKNLPRVSTSRDEYLFPVKKAYVTNYYFPYGEGEDTLYYLKQSYRHLPAFYRKDKQGEHRIRMRDISNDQQFSYRNGQIVYAAFRSDPRWGWRNYSDIKLLDTRTGKQRDITRHSKYFTPDISPDGNRIVAVSMPANGTCELHILQVKDGSLIARIHSPDINVFTDPKFITNDSLVTAVRLQNGEMTLAVGSIENGSLVRLLPPSFNVMGYPCVYHHLIFFTASFGGNDDVFVLKMDDQKIYRVTHGPLGNYYVNAAGGKITWSAFTAEGFQLKQIAENPADWEEIKPGTEEKLTERFSVSHEGETGDILNGTIPLRQFPTGKYAKGTGLLNLHSWRPYFEDPIFTFSLYGENVLNTLQSQLYYLYNRDDKTSAVGFSTTYGAAFPYISAGAEYTFDRRTGNGPQDHHWNQLDSRIGFIIPINFASGRTFKSFSFSNYYVLRNVFNKGYYKDSIGNTSFSYLLHSLSYTEQLPTAPQHIYPRFAYSLSSSYRYPISLYSGYQFYASAALYLPGLLANHNLILSSAFQQRDTSRLLFSSRMANARGYEDYYGTDAGSRLWRWSANYHLPLFHPDWGFGNMLYIQRLRANIFYDMQRIFSNDKSLHLDFHSTGVEFFADTKWWNQYPLTFGFRISHLLDDDPLAGAAKGSNFYEFILPVSIFPK